MSNKHLYRHPRVFARNHVFLRERTSSRPEKFKICRFYPIEYVCVHLNHSSKSELSIVRSIDRQLLYLVQSLPNNVATPPVLPPDFFLGEIGEEENLHRKIPPYVNMVMYGKNTRNALKKASFLAIANQAFKWKAVNFRGVENRSRQPNLRPIAQKSFFNRKFASRVAEIAKSSPI